MLLRAPFSCFRFQWLPPSTSLGAPRRQGRMSSSHEWMSSGGAKRFRRTHTEAVRGRVSAAGAHRPARWVAALGLRSWSRGGGSPTVGSRRRSPLASHSPGSLHVSGAFGDARPKLRGAILAFAATAAPRRPRPSEDGSATRDSYLSQGWRRCHTAIAGPTTHSPPPTALPLPLTPRAHLRSHIGLRQREQNRTGLPSRALRTAWLQLSCTLISSARVARALWPRSS